MSPVIVPAWRSSKAIERRKGTRQNLVISMNERAGSESLEKPRQFRVPERREFHRKRTLENCRRSWLFSLILISKSTWGNYSRPGKESSEKNKRNNAWHSHGDRNGACSCSHQTDWKNSSCIGSMLQKVLHQQWEIPHSRWALILIHLTNHKANWKG